MEKMDIRFSQALDGYLLMAQARRLSPRTLEDYFTTFNKFSVFLGCDPSVSTITSKEIKRFIANYPLLSSKTLLNYHTGLSSLWNWMVKEELAVENVVRQVPPPRPEKRAISPYSKRDVCSMLTNLGKGAIRSRAIILLLLDTGLRASELCKLTIGDVDLNNRRIKVLGKGLKERILPISPRTAQAIWKYLTKRSVDTKYKGEPLLLQSNGLRLKRRNLYKLILRIAKKAGVEGAGVHRFRHTYAINYLRNGGNAFSLQISLGHATSDMTQRYLEIVDTDIQQIHNRASPVSNWNL
jgi:site-specific recombinase XerD